MIDEYVADPSPSVLIVPAAPAACAEAFGLIADGGVHGALTDVEIDLTPMAVRSVAGGVLILSPRVVSLARELPSLTSRERAVLHLIAEGIPLTEIARRLHLSYSTVKRVVAALFDAFGVRSRVELVLAAERLGLL